jgi:hypothetical protein
MEADQRDRAHSPAAIPSTTTMTDRDTKVNVTDNEYFWN